MSNPLQSVSRGSLQLGHAASSQLRWVLADITGLVEEARLERNLSPLAAIGLGQMLSAAAMLTRLVAKRPLRMLLEASGDGPLGRIRAEADTLGNLRGLVERASAPGFSETVSNPELGAGTLRVVRHSDKRSYESKVELVGGGVASNVAHFLDTSEQIRSAVLLGVRAEKDGIIAGGGMIVQILPGADPSIVRRLEQRISTLPGTSDLLRDSGPSGLLAAVLADLEPQTLHEAPLTLSCDCDRARFRDHIRSLAEQEPALVDESEDTCVECSFCGATYVFSASELMPTVN